LNNHILWSIIIKDNILIWAFIFSNSLKNNVEIVPIEVKNAKNT
jgi:hypothetical protein